MCNIKCASVHWIPTVTQFGGGGGRGGGFFSKIHKSLILGKGGGHPGGGGPTNLPPTPGSAGLLKKMN